MCITCLGRPMHLSVTDSQTIKWSLTAVSLPIQATQTRRQEGVNCFLKNIFVWNEKHETEKYVHRASTFSYHWMDAAILFISGHHYLNQVFLNFISYLKLYLFVAPITNNLSSEFVAAPSWKFTNHFWFNNFFQMVHYLIHTCML